MISELNVLNYPSCWYDFKLFKLLFLTNALHRNGFAKMIISPRIQGTFLAFKAIIMAMFARNFE